MRRTVRSIIKVLNACKSSKFFSENFFLMILFNTTSKSHNYMSVFLKIDAIFFSMKICCQTDQNMLQKTLFDMFIVFNELLIIELRSSIVARSTGMSIVLSLPPIYYGYALYIYYICTGCTCHRPKVYLW